MSDIVKTRNSRRSLTGVVVSNKMDKTVTVLVDMQKKHPKYGKYVKSSNKYHAHDEKNEVNEGDLVEIVETKKYSKIKAWRVDKILERAE
ncbi:MAG: 30S ribosomal protein S17 [Planctomycetota bacterium]|jgi:small subunit ribosomal protein S17